MKIPTFTCAALTIALMAAAGASVTAEEAPELYVPTEHGVSPTVSAEVEEDHGDGLGPHGRDLHNRNTSLETVEDDAELFLQSLEESPQPIVNIDAGTPEEPGAGTASGG